MRFMCHICYGPACCVVSCLCAACAVPTLCAVQTSCSPCAECSASDSPSVRRVGVYTNLERTVEATSKRESPKLKQGVQPRSRTYACRWIHQEAAFTESRCLWVRDETGSLSRRPDCRARGGRDCLVLEQAMRLFQPLLPALTLPTVP